ncbi:MAG: carboxypeptidase regulatory-like domain-containing protein [Candidatus Moranbacteria bacterium]|nr:carboxypeptidase regulatory-like domain-containing protein [Candidatus Moranbacteria bacterium]
MFLLKTKVCRKPSLASNGSGFTLIEALVLLFVFSVITTTFYSVFTLGGRYIIESKNRLGAVALANEKMEIIRNLQYDDIGIVGGIPIGNIPAEEDVVESNHTYHVKTFIQYVDDPFDGISPIDLDYKRVKVTVSWRGVGDGDSNTFLVARFVPPGIEQNLAGGTLSVNVIGSDGIGVPQALVHIVNDEISPGVNLSVMTDDTGNLMLPGAQQSIQGYDITVSKDSYETVETIDPTSVTYSIIDTPASVVENMLNVKSIVQDKLIDLKFTSVDYLGNALPDVTFHMEGGRILGYDMLQSPAAPVYKVVSDSTTDENGEENFEDISPSQFFISNIGVVADHTLIGLDNLSNFDPIGSKYAVLVAPGDSQEVKIRFAKNIDNSLLLNVLKAADDTPLADAYVELTNTDGYNGSATTMVDGVVFFPVSTDPLVAGTYNLKITAEGYEEYSGTVAIDKLTTQQIKLIAVE